MGCLLLNFSRPIAQHTGPARSRIKWVPILAQALQNIYLFYFKLINLIKVDIYISPTFVMPEKKFKKKS